MRKHRSISSRGIVAVLALALFAAALAGCGFGRASNEEKISKTADTYLRALAHGDTAKACKQLTRRAKGEACAAALKGRLSWLDADALNDAAGDSLDIDVDGDTATAGLSKPESARFVLTRVGGEWRIDSGYTLDAATSA